MQSVSLKTFRHSEMCVHPLVCLKGTCYLITREHSVELFDLEDEALLGFMKEVQMAARVLKQVTGAFKINYEMHGNTAQHLCTYTCLPATWMILSLAAQSFTAAMTRQCTREMSLTAL